MRGPDAYRPGLPPAFLELAAHPLRWRVLTELSRSDRRVHELTTLLGEPQPLVSYHLRKLSSAALLSVRRSSFDGRQSYYSLDLGRCGAMLAEAGAALHPALAVAPRTDAGPATWARRPRVLFLCTGNSARSQIAEALLRELGAEAVEAFSAGSAPKPLHPNAVRVLRSRGIDLSGRSSKHLDTLSHRRFDCVISLCDRVREVCPEFPGRPATIHWSIADPASGPGDDEETYPAFEQTLAELEARIRFLLHRLHLEVSRA